MIRHSTALFSVAFVCLAAPGFAQDASPDAPPAHISFVDGPVILERDGRPDSSPGSMPLLAGDRIRTQGGRAEVLFADGSTLHIDTHTVIDFQSDEVVRLLEGRIRLSIAGQARGLSYRVDAPGGWVDIAESGEYRIAVLSDQGAPQVELAVLRGGAELVNENGRSFVRAGERSFARADAQPSPPYVFNSAAWDAFDRWSEARRDQRLGVSAEYLPSDVRPYSATFDSYGSWRHEPVHGYVWYPRVRVGWRPYYHGRWVSLRPYGWTWISADPWGWPTHHYGRWGFSSGAWFWIPGRRWGAAWVSWAHAPGYLSWCPLGWNDRPVFSFININLFGGRRYDRWHAWTVVPRRHFGRGFVNVHHIVSPRFDTRVHRSFVVRDRGPEGYAVPRASRAILRAGARTGYAVPRGSTGSTLSASQSPRITSPGSRITSPGSRSFPSPAREPRSVGRRVGGSADRASRPTTAAPPRAVPRDRSVEREGGVSSVERGRASSDRTPVAAPGRTDRVTVPGSRGAPQRREQPDASRRIDAAPSAPPAATRAVPRRSPESTPQGRNQSEWRRYDRPSSIPAPRRAPEYRMPDNQPPGPRPDAGARRAPGGGSRERYRAAPRQDAPRPSTGAPQPRLRRPAEASAQAGAPRGESPRSYGSAGGGSAPRSYRAPESRRPSASSPSADRPSRSAPSGDSGRSRSRGGAPSQGQASRRPGGR